MKPATLAVSLGLASAAAFGAWIAVNDAAAQPEAEAAIAPAAQALPVRMETVT
jgi:alpha/beta superfamily hydrolase